MPINDYAGETFVAFTDISGFKVMMKDNDQAVRAIDHFYTTGYRCLQSEPEVNGFFVSDCGILFSRATAPHCGLNRLLNVIETLNRQLLREDIILTTSIAFGQFSYHQRLEFPGVEKNPIYGNAYVTAFLDNENGKPKIEPGECRIVAQGTEGQPIDEIKRIQRRQNHLYFYWMVDDDNEVAEFRTKYTNSYQLKYRGMLEALKWKGQPTQEHVH